MASSMSWLYFTRRVRAAGVGGLGELDGLLQQVVHAFAAVADGEHHRHVQQFGQLRGVDFRAPAVGHVGHVEGEEHLAVEFPDLGRQIQAALEVGGVDDVDDDVRPLVQQKVAGDDFLDRKRGQAVSAGQVDDGQVVSIAGYVPFLLFNGDPGPVPDFLAGAGEVVEDGCFAGVGVAGQGDDKTFSRHRRTVYRTFSTRMLGGFLHPQGNVIALDDQLHGVLQRGVFFDTHLGTLENSHFENSPPQQALPADAHNGRTLAFFQFTEQHVEILNGADLGVGPLLPSIF